jgi:hypothetical protein
MQEDLYCKMYVAIEKSRDELITLLPTLTGGEVSFRTIRSSQSLIDVVSNDDFDKELMRNPDGFVYFPYYLEIEPANENGADLDEYKSMLKNLLVSLKEFGAQVVPSCDFEDEFNL